MEVSRLKTRDRFLPSSNTQQRLARRGVQQEHPGSGVPGAGWGGFPSSGCGWGGVRTDPFRCLRPKDPRSRGPRAPPQVPHLSLSPHGRGALVPVIRASGHLPPPQDAPQGRAPLPRLSCAPAGVPSVNTHTVGRERMEERRPLPSPHSVPLKPVGVALLGLRALRQLLGAPRAL